MPLMATVEALVTEAASRYRKLARAHGGHTEDRQPSTLRVLWRFPDRLPKGAYLTPPVTWAQSVGVAAAGPQHIHPAKSLEGVPERIRRIEAKKGVAKGTLKNPYTPLVDLQKQHRIGILGLHKYQPYKQETPLVVVCPSQRICDSFHEARYYKT